MFAQLELPSNAATLFGKQRNDGPCFRQSKAWIPQSAAGSDPGNKEVHRYRRGRDCGINVKAV